MVSIQITEGENASLPFPKLMKSYKTGLIILAASRGKTYMTGTQLNETPHSLPGTYSERWDPEEFEDFNGEVALSNEYSIDISSMA